MELVCLTRAAAALRAISRSRVAKNTFQIEYFVSPSSVFLIFPLISIMDASTISAIAALVVALIALVIATAQATQQYFITGQGIRLCDSVVFSDMPGQGHRIWQASQFRFRVVYSIPQISLPNDLWPRNWSVSHKDRRHSLPYLPKRADPHRPTRPWGVISIRRKRFYKIKRRIIGYFYKIKRQMIYVFGHFRDGTESSRSLVDNNSSVGGRGPWPPSEGSVELKTGEAAWVSFCKIIYYSCHGNIRYDLVERDVDRCPTDLPTVPMPVSLRDIVAMALSIGMHCTEASFTSRSLSMQG